MPTYDFATITPAQALAITPADRVNFIEIAYGNTLDVNINDNDQLITITATQSGRTIIFGPGFFNSFSFLTNNEHLEIGSSGSDFISGYYEADAIYGGGGADTISGANNTNWLSGGLGADLFVIEPGTVDTSDRILDWERSDHLYFSQLAGTNDNFAKATAATDDEARNVAKNLLSNGIVHYVAVAVGTDVEIFSNRSRGWEEVPPPYAILINRTLNDITPANIVGGAMPTAPASPPTATHAWGVGGAQGFLTGNMDAAHIADLIGSAIVSPTNTSLSLRGDHENLLLLGSGFTYDRDDQLIGGVVSSVIYTGSTGFQANLVVHDLSAAPFSQWVATDANQTAFSTILSGNDRVGGSSGDDVIRGYAGSDLIYGDGGHDSLYGGDGDDAIYAAFAPDMIGTPGAGGAYMRGELGDDSITGGGFADYVNGNQGADTIDGGSGGDDWLLGGQGNDVIFAHAGNTIMNGNLGDDSITGGLGADAIRGGQGNDVLQGGLGDDLLFGDRGDDTMTGGGGADTFHASPGGGVDRILDFNTAQGDHVILDGVSPGTAVIAQRGSDTVIDLGHGDQIILLGVNQATLPQGWLIGA